MRVRRHARVVAFQTLYEVFTVGHDPHITFAQRLGDGALPTSGIEFARSLVEGVTEHLGDLDRIIGRIAPEWPVQQLAPVDRSILYIATYEITVAREAPVKVAINEAVELAKTFGSESSQRFVNGALGALVREPVHRTGDAE